MRIKFAKALTLLIILLNVVAFYFLWNLLGRHNVYSSSKTAKLVGDEPKNDFHQKNIDEIIQNNVTVIFREFESFDNDVPNTVRSITSTYPNISILIVSNSPPYPPLLFNTSNQLFHNVRHVYLQLNLDNSFKARTPIYQIKTNYVLFMPDSARIHTKKTIEKMFRVLQSQEKIVAATFKASKPVSCLNTHINQREWVVQFEEAFDNTCDFIKGKHATLVNTEILKELTDTFMLPFPDAFYIQTAAKGIKTYLLNDFPFGSGKELYRNPHNQWKAQQLEKDRTYHMFRNLGLKKFRNCV